GFDGHGKKRQARCPAGCGPGRALAPRARRLTYGFAGALAGVMVDMQHAKLAQINVAVGSPYLRHRERRPHWQSPVSADPFLFLLSIPAIRAKRRPTTPTHRRSQGHAPRGSRAAMPPWPQRSVLATTGP